MVRVRCWGREVREGDQLRVGGDQISSVWTRSPNRGAVVADIPAVAREVGGRVLRREKPGKLRILHGTPGGHKIVLGAVIVVVVRRETCIGGRFPWQREQGFP